MLEIQVESSADYIVCRPVGELDAYTVGQFREQLAELATAGVGLARVRRTGGAPTCRAARRSTSSTLSTAWRFSLKTLTTPAGGAMMRW